MRKAKPILNIEQTVSKVKGLEKAFKKLKQTAIYVGIPYGSKGDARNDSPITNSQLGFIHERGSPSANIPARPFLGPGVESVIDDLRAGMQASAKAIIAEDESGFDAELEKTAIRAVSGVKDYMSSAHFVPLAPATVRARRKKIKSDDQTIKPLIDTGSLRDAIDGVVVKE